MPTTTPIDLLSEEGLDEATRRALAIYDAKLKAVLEPEHVGETVAIHLDTEDYAVARNSPLARAALRKRHPHGMIATINIGLDPGSPLAMRLLASQPVGSRPAK